MKSSLCILFFLFTSTLIAQDVYYPLGIGDRWQYVVVIPGYPTELVEFRVVTDTVMPNSNRYAVHVQTLAGPQHVWYPTYQRQAASQVFLYNPRVGQEYLMYDFTRAVGDTIGFYVADYDTFDVILISYQLGNFWGVQRRTWEFGHRVRRLTDGSKSTFIVDSLGVYQYTLDTEPHYFVGAVISGRTYGNIVAVETRHDEFPQEPQLYQNFPNPFNGTTSIRYYLPKAGEVDFRVFDLLGRTIATLVHQTKTAGNHSVTFDSQSLASGMYIVRLSVAGISQSRPILLLK